MGGAKLSRNLRPGPENKAAFARCALVAAVAAAMAMATNASASQTTNQARGDVWREAATAAAMAEKIANLRIFNDKQGKMNRSLLDTGGAVLAVSQFTLYGDARGQRRPSFLQAAPPDQGKAGYEEFVRALQALNVRVETGVFQAHMSLEIVNDGPVTILLDSDKVF